MAHRTAYDRITNCCGSLQNVISVLSNLLQTCGNDSRWLWLVSYSTNQYPITAVNPCYDRQYEAEDFAARLPRYMARFWFRRSCPGLRDNMCNSRMMLRKMTWPDGGC